jgi:hypothetical protein
MKQRMRLWVAVCLSLWLTGCGTQVALSGQAREDYLKSIKPYLHYWDKPGMINEVRGQDSLNCGGSNGGPDFSAQQLNIVRQSEDKNDFAPRARLHHEWQRCMIKKGYRFTGKCYDNEISRTSPACGAP